MEEVLTNPSVIRVSALLKELGCSGEVTILSDSARTALDAANALGIEVGQVASSIVFKLPNGNPLLVITSGRHRVDTDLVAKNLGVEKLHRADADFVKNASGFSIGGVSPVGWVNQPEITLIDQALNDYDVAWAAAGHPHSVYPTSYSELARVTGATSMVVGD
ncbi:MAG: YbaK/EbsC family protein [Actinomycetales bacterium]|nr:MAG: YbaK/EbsC family protein [Actinomycetales bacterium]